MLFFVQQKKEAMQTFMRDLRWVVFCWACVHCCAGALAFSGVCSNSLRVPGECQGKRRYRLGVQMSVGKKRPAISKAFKKPTGALTVSLEYSRVDSSKYSENDLTVLSMQLRKAKAAAVWTASLDDLAIIAEEQQSAKGNFPGPCPVIFYPYLGSPSEEQVRIAAETGATAVTLRCGATDAAIKADSCGLEVIWDVRTVEEIKQAVDLGKGLRPHPSTPRPCVLSWIMDSTPWTGRMPNDGYVRNDMMLTMQHCEPGITWAEISGLRFLASHYNKSRSSSTPEVRLVIGELQCCQHCDS